MATMMIATRTTSCVLVAGSVLSSALAQTSTAPGASGQEPPLVSGAMTGIGDGMSEEQIRGFLRAKGYTDLGRFERDGDAFTIDRAKRFGREVTNLRVDAGTGQVADLSPLNRQQVEVLLEHHGYQSISIREKDEHDFKVQATRGGRSHSLRVDARTAAIQTDCD